MNQYTYRSLVVSIFTFLCLGVSLMYVKYRQQIVLFPRLSQQLGQQLIVELYDCDPNYINNIEYVQSSILEAAREAHATIITHKFHQFSPMGISGIVVIAESHIAIHTWPEYGYCAIDIFTCGNIDNDRALTVLRKNFKSKRESIVNCKRGIIHSPTTPLQEELPSVNQQ